MATPKRVIKLQLTEEDHRMVRVAAAINDKTMAEYCRELVLREAGKHAEVALPKNGKDDRRAPKKS